MPWQMIISVALNALAVLNFILAFIFPFAYRFFIFNGAILVFFFEFLNIHSTGFMSAFDSISNQWVRLMPKFLMFGFYIWFIWPFLFVSVISGLLFTLSLCSKVIFNLGKASIGKFYLFQFCWFLISVFIFAFLPSWAVTVFKLPQAIFWEANPQNIGLWNRYPQYILLWGIVYYFGLILIQIYLHKNKDKT